MKEMETRGCELCRNRARVHCESDQAMLCFDCDGKVHGANFLVAKHCRSLLCHSCGAPTPWRASGPKLGPTVSVCVSCLRRNKREEEDVDEDEDEDEEEDIDGGDYSSSCSDGDDDDDECSDEDDGENQVVPWGCCDSCDTVSSSSSSQPPPPMPSCSSSSDEAPFVGDGGGATVSSSFKRRRDVSPLDSDDEGGCFSHMRNSSFASSSSSLRPVKIARTTNNLIAQIQGDILDQESRKLGIMRSLIRLQHKMVDGDDHQQASASNPRDF